MELSSETKKTTLGRLAALAPMVKTKSAHKEKKNLRMRMGSGMIETLKRQPVNYAPHECLSSCLFDKLRLIGKPQILQFLNFSGHPFGQIAGLSAIFPKIK